MAELLILIIRYKRPDDKCTRNMHLGLHFIDVGTREAEYVFQFDLHEGKN